MQHDPFRIPAPFVVSFSGGRTSGYMLRRVLDAHGGRMPDGSAVVFCNTGKERPETLDFVERCSARWDVPIIWLEYRHLNGPKFEVVDYATASRDGEPFEQLIQAKQRLPTPVMRFCTIEMKLRTCQRYLRSIGWESWTNAIGMRADEPQRVARLNNQRDDYEMAVCPLYQAGIDKPSVLGWWGRQSFDLGLAEHEGNCDLCFLKAKSKILRQLYTRPELAAWWIRQEVSTPHKRLNREGRFRDDRVGYAALLQLSKQPTLFPMDERDELSIACHCTD